MNQSVGRLAADAELARLAIEERADGGELIAEPDVVEETRHLLGRGASLGAAEHEVMQVRQVVLASAARTALRIPSVSSACATPRLESITAGRPPV